MKKLLLLLSLLLYPIIGLPQERINREVLSFSAKRSVVITKATGWAYNENSGQWISYQNVISTDDRWTGSLKSYLNTPTMKSHFYCHNFNWFQFRTVLCGDSNYYVLVVERWDGSFKYPAIMEDWRSYKTTYGYVFTESDYNNLSNLLNSVDASEENSLSLVTIRYSHSGDEYESYSEGKLLSNIYNEIYGDETQWNNSFSVNFNLKRIKSNGNEMIRFWLPDNKSNSDNCKNMYYELPLSEFKKILIN